MTKKRRNPFDLDDLLDAPFDALDKAFEAVDDGLEYLDGKMDDLLGDADVTLEESMAKLDRKMRDLDTKLGNQKRRTFRHKLSFKHNGATIKVKYNNADDMSIHTTGDLDNGLMRIIKERIREQDHDRRPIDSIDDTIRDLQRMAGTAMRRGVPLLCARTWRGGRGDQLEIHPTSTVTVSVGGMFGRKYTVEIDGTTVYFVKNEEMMERCWARGDLELLIQSWTRPEAVIMLQIIELLRKSHIAEEHHEEVAKRLTDILS